MKKIEITLIFVILLEISIVSIFSNELLNKRDSPSGEYYCKNCNVILITADSLRADHLGMYGYGKNTSPFLDSFSKDAYLFINSISQSGSTMPSLPSLHTGKYPYVDDILNGTFLYENQTTIAEVLAGKGYDTKAAVSVIYAKSVFGLSQGFNRYEDDFTESFRIGNETTDIAIDLLGNISQPFFLWLHYKEPHWSWDAPERYPRSFYENLTGLRHNSDKEGYILYGVNRNLSYEDILELRALYDEQINYLDKNLDDILSYLVKSDLMDNTIIIITADHGESLGEHKQFDHNSLYYCVTHVPLIVKLPNKNGGRIQYPVSSVDIFPTLLEILDLDYNGMTRGKNLFDSNRSEYMQFSELGSEIAILYNNWKLIEGLDPKGDELFYIPDDPSEENNLKNINTTKYSFLDNILQNMVLPEERDKSNMKTNLSDNFDETVKEELRELGYYV